MTILLTQIALAVLTGVMCTQEGGDASSSLAPAVTLVLRLSVRQLLQGGWRDAGGRRAAGEEVRNVLPEAWAQSQMLITMAWGCWSPTVCVI